MTSSRYLATYPVRREIVRDGRYISTHHHRPRSEPNLNDRLRYDVSEIVENTLSSTLEQHITRLSGVEENFRQSIATIQSTLEFHLQQPQATPVEGVSSIGHVTQPEGKNAQVQELEKRLNATVAEREGLAKKLDLSNERARKFQEVIINSGIGSSGLNDEEIQKQFEKLHDNIFQNVQKYCTAQNRESTVDDARYAKLNLGSQDHYIVSVIANTLYQKCFSKERAIFGFDAQTDKTMNEIYHDKKIQAKVQALKVANVVVEHLRPYMKPSWVQNPESSLTKDFEHSLINICDSALKLALTLNCSETEYVWAQDRIRGSSFESGHIQVVGTAGHKTFEEAHREQQDYIIIFGGVCKGADVQGVLDENPIYLSETDVILGPFKSRSGT
ncbi:MAG: hypothetical protein M1821_006726 [Bathelium mastoideum]|nr:MAG: hypothetical protein M1821_006726 [Bathelium mastoideum]